MREKFISDLHLGHGGVIEYCKRPFQSVEEMDLILTKRWNERVSVEDVVYVLGDVCFHKASIGIPLIQKLNGQKILVKGNHDKWSDTQYRKAGFVAVVTEMKLTLRGIGFKLSHYPYTPKPYEMVIEDVRYLERRPVDQGGWLLCGHVHERWKTKDRMINVGVDQWNYYPVSIDEIDSLIRKTHPVL